MRYTLLLLVLLTACSSPTRPSAPLPPVQAVLAIVEDSFTVTTEPDGTFRAAASVVNRGDGCALQVSGTLRITQQGTELLTAPITIPPTIRPGETVTMTACCLPVGTTGEYLGSPVWAFTSARCP